MAEAVKSGDTPAIAVVVVQPTPFCNINCSYCYLPARNDRTTITRETLRALFERVLASGWSENQLTVIWHAGEPLVLPVAFYQDAFALIDSLRPSDIAIRHSFQTNGMLLSTDWCELFKQWQVGVGVSIDGPKHLNDAHRLGRSGRSTFDSAVAGIRLLRRERVPFHVISVLTERSLESPDEMLEFYRTEGIADICFNVEESEGAHVSTLFASAAPRERFRRFLGHFWREARKDQRVRFVREIDAMLARVFRPGDETINNVQVEPFAMLNVDCRGNVSTFSPELLGLKNPIYDDFIIGNVHTHTLEDMRANPALQAMARDVASGVARCRSTCEYFSVCAGGAPINKLSENGSFDSARTGFCTLTQMVPTDLILEAFEQLQGQAETHSASELVQQLTARSSGPQPDMVL
jgi:uncharacterized protein